MKKKTAVTKAKAKRAPAKKMKKATSKKASSTNASAAWQPTRRVLFRPDRFAYLTQEKIKTCVFCEALKSGIGEKNLLLYQSSFSMVIINKYPYNNGHLLVLPKKHVGHLLGLTNEEFSDLNLTVRTTIKVIEQAYRPQGVNVGLNLGAASGAGIPDHMHYHLIPRWAGDLNFFPLIADTKVVTQSLQQTFERLRPYFEREFGQKFERDVD